MKLRANLLALVLGALLPLLALATVGATLFVQRERAAIERDAIGLVRAAMSAIDAELRGSASALEALAAVGPWNDPELPHVQDELRAVLASQPGWINLTLFTADASRRVDAILGQAPPAAPPAAEPALIRAALASPELVVGDIVRSDVVHAAGARIYLPVRVNGKAAYVLSATLRPELFADVLRAQKLPPSWVIALVDRKRTFVARIPPRAAGEPIAPSFRAALDAAPEGFFRGQTVEGLQSFTPYVTSSLSGWALGIAIPADVVAAGARQLGWLLAAGLLLAVTVGVALAWFVARRIAMPIHALAESTATLGQAAHAIAAPASRIDEIGRLHDAMSAAHQAMLDRERLLGRERDALRAADKAKDEFIAMLSHELRNPLAAMTSAAHVLKLADPSATPALRAREVIARQARHMSRLIEDLLDVNRILMGKIQLARQPANLGEIVDACASTWIAGGRLGQRTLAVAAAEVWVDVDRTRIEQVVTNLLANAVKFSSDGSALAIEVGRDRGEARLVVRDQGEGFTSQAQEWMFNLFAQGATRLDRPKGGLGIGLAVVKRLVEMHGGSVEAASEGPGKGASFTVRLPAIPAPSTLAVPAALLPTASGKRILVVEDNDDVAAMLRSLLELGGHTVRTASDGESGLAAARSARFDVAFVDIGLPDIDGYEVVRRLRAESHGAGMRVIALTGYGQAEDRRRAIVAGFDRHLTKPVDPGELAVALAGNDDAATPPNGDGRGVGVC